MRLLEIFLDAMFLVKMALRNRGVYITIICVVVSLLSAGCSRNSVQTKAERQTCSTAEGHLARELMKRAPEAIVSQTINLNEYVGDVCASIAECQDAKVRAGLYREFMQKAACAPFEKLEEDCGEVNDLAGPIRARDAEIRLSNAYGALAKVAEEVWLRQYLDGACGVEQFAPLFDLIVALKRESRRRGREDAALYEGCVEHVERLFNLFYLADPRQTPSVDDRVQVENRFGEIVGRPIRSRERYFADSIGVPRT